MSAFVRNSARFTTIVAKSQAQKKREFCFFQTYNAKKIGRAIYVTQSDVDEDSNLV